MSKIINLDGEWSFFYGPEKFTPVTSCLPERSKFTGLMVTPGYWDDHYELFDEQDFFGLRARFNPDYRKVHFPMGTSLTPHACSSFLVGSGYYRKLVTLDFAPGDRIYLNVGPAMWGVAVYCNGILAGEATGYSVATEFELSDLLRSGEENEIVLVVCNVNDDGGAYCRADGSHNGGDFGTRPGQHRGLAAQGYQSERGGIGGGVFLRLAGKSAITDRFISFETGQVHWHFEVANPAGCILKWSIADASGVVDSGSCECSGESFDFFTDSSKLKRWSDRSPELYTCSAELIAADKTLADSCSWKWGAREIRCEGVQIMVNGLPTYFRGATEHCYFAETCNPHFDYDRYIREMGVLKKAGFNFIRCHTWCPPEPFYDACDTLGIFVQTEFPSIYSLDEAAAILKMIRRHTCAVILCEGNEKRIHTVAMDRMRKVEQMMRRLVPGMLFNPQEAIRGVEYDFMPNREITEYPMLHDAERFAEIAEISDVYGCLSGGVFSYGHDEFPGVDVVNERLSIFKKPCLSHEIGILGGYLNFDLEKRYEGTFIGTDMFQAARDNMKRHGVYQYADTYYRYNSLFISSIRKQLVENLRSCSALNGYDYLGGIDTHWHLFGYPCGIFDEFYEEKYGETISDVCRYNGESVLLCSALNRRNYFAGSTFDEELKISYYGSSTVNDGTAVWSFELADGGVIAEGQAAVSDLNPGTLAVLCPVKIDLPESDIPYGCVLRARVCLNGEVVENFWKFYIFPAAQGAAAPGVLEIDTLTAEAVSFAEKGGAVLLTGSFPCKTEPETFRPHTSGRCIRHAGVILHDHPVWRDFPHEGFMDWQFHKLMSDSTSLVYDRDMPEYDVIMELIPSFKLIHRKTVLTEFQVGMGRIIMCGMNMDESDPAARYIRKALLDYLASRDYAPAREWSADDLRRRVADAVGSSCKHVKIDAGGRPIIE